MPAEAHLYILLSPSRVSVNLPSAVLTLVVGGGHMFLFSGVQESCPKHHNWQQNALTTAPLNGCALNFTLIDKSEEFTKSCVYSKYSTHASLSFDAFATHGVTQRAGRQVQTPLGCCAVPGGGHTLQLLRFSVGDQVAAGLRGSVGACCSERSCGTRAWF